MFKYIPIAAAIVALALTALIQGSAALNLFQLMKDRNVEIRSVDQSNTQENLPVTPLEAKLNFVDDGVRLAVTYTTTPQAEYSVAWDFWPPSSGTLQGTDSTTGNVHENEILVGPEFAERGIVANFDLPASRHDVKVSFTNPSESTGDFVQHLHMTRRTMLSLDEFVYDEIEDVTFDIFHRRDDSVFIAAKQNLIDTGSGKVVRKNLDWRMFEVVDHTRISEIESISTLRLRSSVPATSGYIMLMVYDMQDNNVIVTHGQQLPVRPSSQPNPFPAGYVSAVRIEEENKANVESDGSMKVFCGRDDRCVVECAGVGEQVDSVALRNSETEVDMTPEMSYAEHYIDNNIVSSYYVVPTNDGAPTQYTCTATSAQGNSDTMNIEVVVN